MITLYDFGPTRSARVRWALAELEIEHELIDSQNLFGTEELRKVHPLGALPAILVDGKPLFESAASCTYLADSKPEKEMIAPSGTWERALHDQWTYFAMTEMEAYLWHSARNKFVLPEEQRMPVIFEQNAEGFKRGAAAMEAHLSDNDFLVDNRFTITDVIAGFTVSWGRNMELLGDFPALQRYLDRLHARPHCTLRKPD